MVAAFIAYFLYFTIFNYEWWRDWRKIQSISLFDESSQGKDADLILMKLSDYREIPYEYASNPVSFTIRGGNIL